MIGLAYRAKKVLLGKSCLDEIKKVRFLFIAGDASDKTKERYLKKCAYYDIPYCLEYDGEALSGSLGRNNVKIIGIADEGFKKSILTSLK